MLVLVDGHDNLIHNQMCITHAPMNRNGFCAFSPALYRDIYLSLFGSLCWLLLMFAERMTKTRDIKWIFIARDSQREIAKGNGKMNNMD